MFNPKVSIIIPVYNGSNYMREAIDSALNQTYENIEVIVINDGSNDNGLTKEIALSYSNKIRYYEKDNGGVATALNLGIKNMEGEYFSWLSHDDVYYPDKVKVQIDYLDTLDNKEIILYGDWDSIDENSNRRGIVKLDQEHSINMLNYSIYPVVNGLIHGCSLLIPLLCFKKIGLFNPEFKTTQDYDLVFRLSKKFKFIYIPGLYIKSRVHKGQSRYDLDYLNEGNHLWSRMLESLTFPEILKMDKSIFHFFINKADFLLKIGYAQSANIAIQLSEQFIIENNTKLITQNLPKISVIIPFYNRLNMLYDAIQSVINQTYENFEIILIDDGSTEQMDFNKFNDNRIRYYKQKNKGPSTARNNGIAHATGEYISFLDCDDLFFPNKLKEQINFMINNKDIVFSHTSYFRIDNNKNIFEYMKTGTFKGNVYPSMLLNCPISPSTVMINKKIIDNNIIFPEDIRLGEDTIFYIKIARIYPIYGIELPLSKVRIHNNNATSNPKNYLDGHYNILKFTNKTDKSLSKDLKKEFLINLYKAISTIYHKKRNYIFSYYYFIKSVIINRL